MSPKTERQVESSMPWIMATLFYIGGVAMTFLGVPVAILMGVVMLIALPIAWAFNWPAIRAQRKREKKELRLRRLSEETNGGRP